MKVLRFKQLRERVPYTRMHVNRLEKAGQFPKRIQLGPNSVGWLESEIEEWIAVRAAARTALPRRGHSVPEGELDPELAAMLS